ncbi:MAG: hypothetical protein V1932_02175 [Chloroflexota bacterium]
MNKRTDPSVIKYHLLQALAASMAELNGDEAQSRRLHAEVKLGLINMSNEERWELARVTKPPEQTIEASYKKFKEMVEEHKTTASEWMKDLSPNTIFGRDGNDGS